MRTIHFKTIIAGLMVAVFAAGPATAKTKNPITSITPASAHPDEPVTISGNGFGGHNVRITVGGVPARVLTASGSRATFLVPHAVPIGLTTVKATNPGGHEGSIGFQVLSGSAVDLDPTSSVHELIGPSGGDIVTQSRGATYAFTIPPDALDADTTITLAAVTSINNLPFSGGIVAAVQFEPSGLQLKRPATLTITLPGPVDTTGLLGFLVDDQGLNLEVFPVTADLLTLTIPVSHFTAAGAASASLLDFVRQVEPLLDVLPPTLPPTQVAALQTVLTAWIQRFGFEVCSQTNLCQRVLELGIQSLVFHQTEACARAETFIQQGEPHFAREALKSVVVTAVGLVLVRDLAGQAGVPGFDQSFDLACVEQTLPKIVDLAKAQALANPRAGLLTLILDISSDAGLLGLEDLQIDVQASLTEVLTNLVTEAEQLCQTDPPAVGEFIINQIFLAFNPAFLDGLVTGLTDRMRNALAGCRIQIDPLQATVGIEQTVQFTATTQELSPPGVTWSIKSQSSDSTIDPQKGLFTAGQFEGTVVVKATSLASSAATNLFKLANVTVVPVVVTVSPKTVTVNNGGTVQFSAEVTGTPNTAVKWTFFGDNGGGTLDQNGLFTAGTSPGVFEVDATSVAVTSRFGFATVTVSVPEVTVTVSPSSVSLARGETQQFTATVTGTANTDVGWGATGGTIDQNGLFTAGDTAGDFAVAATSVADTSKSGTATVSIRSCTVRVSPSSTVSVRPGGQAQFKATGTGNGAVSWTVGGGGSIVPDPVDPTIGVFTAGGAAGGPFEVRATTVDCGSATGSVRISSCAILVHSECVHADYGGFAGAGNNAVLLNASGCGSVFIASSSLDPALHFCCGGIFYNNIFPPNTPPGSDATATVTFRDGSHPDESLTLTYTFHMGTGGCTDGNQHCPAGTTSISGDCAP